MNVSFRITRRGLARGYGPDCKERMIRVYCPIVLHRAAMTWGLIGDRMSGYHDRFGLERILPSSSRAFDNHECEPARGDPPRRGVCSIDPGGRGHPPGGIAIGPLALVRPLGSSTWTYHAMD